MSAQQAKSYGTLSPAATPQRSSRTHLSSPLLGTPTLLNGRPGMSGGSSSFEDEDVLHGEGEFNDEVDDRSLWMRRGRQGKATMASCISNLANTIIGSGALAFPSVFASMGLIPAFFSCLFAGACSAFGLYLLSLAARQVGRPTSQPSTAFSSSGPNTPAKRISSADESDIDDDLDNRTAFSTSILKSKYDKPEASFNQIALLTFGKGWATRCFDAAIAIKCFGVSVSYLIIVKTLMPQVILSLSHHLPSETLPEDSMWLDGRLWLLLSLVIVGPLSFLRRMDSLRFTSQIALASVVYLVIIVVGWWAFDVPTGKKKGTIVWARFATSTLGVFPVQIFAYTCAQNIFAVFNELKFNTQKRMTQVITISIGSAAITYEVLGIIGYLTFGSGVGSNVIAMYPWTSIIIAIGRVGIVLLVALSYPLQAHPCRACLHTLTSGLIKKKQDPNSSMEVNEEEDDLLDTKDDHGMPVGKPMGNKKFTALTVAIIVFGFAIAMVIDELEVVLSFVGSTGSTMISFILPGMFYFSLFRHEGGITKWLALALSIYGMFVMVFCLSFNIYKLSNHQVVRH